MPPGVKQALKRVPLLEWLYSLTFRFANRYSMWQKQVEPALWLPVEQSTAIKVSIIVPVYNPALGFLKECVESVKAQTYANWQLILVNDASTDASVNSYLSSLERTESSLDIVVLASNTNRHISHATNMGIGAATGEVVTFLDHDDKLSPHACNELVHAFERNPNWEWVYSDEDLMTEKGKRVVPHFKSDWNPYLLQAHNYITHISAYKRDVLKQLVGCREGFEGAQDYDLSLRAATLLSAEQIGHVPKVLYHWRMHKGSTAAKSSAKPYTHTVGKKALQQHLQKKGVDAEVVDGSIDNFYQVNYRCSTWPKVSIIVPTKDNKAVLEACVSSVLERTDYDDYELLIVNNQSSEEDALRYLETLKSTTRCTVLDYDKPFNYSAINNFAVQHATGEVLVLLNNDTEVITPQWLKQMVGLASQSDVGCVGAKLLYPDNTIQHAGVILGLGGYAAHSHRGLPADQAGYFNRANCNQALSAVTGACLAVSKSIYEQVGGLDESFVVAYNDVDFCLRVQALGLHNVYCAHAKLYHYESKSRGNDSEDPAKAKRFEKEKSLLLSRWQKEINNDPYYNPNLTRAQEDFSIRQD